MEHRYPVVSRNQPLHSGEDSCIQACGSATGQRSWTQVDSATVALLVGRGLSPAWDSLAREFNNLYGLVDLPATVMELDVVFAWEGGALY